MIVVDAIIGGLECAVRLYMVPVGILLLMVVFVTFMLAYVVQSIASWNKSMGIHIRRLLR